MAFGTIGTRYVDLANGITDSFLRSLKTPSGLELADLVGRVDAAMSAVNQGVDPVVASLIAPTTQRDTASHRTTRKILQRGGEYTIVRPQYGSSQYHSLPLYKHEIGIGFTEDGLFDISSEDFDAELQDMVDAFHRAYRGYTLERAFTTTEMAISDKNTSITSPGFIGSGTGSNVYVGTYPDGTPLPGGYTHYQFTNAAGLGAAVTTAISKVQRLNVQGGTIQILGTQGAVDKIKALTGRFVAAGSPYIRAGSGVSEASVDATEYAGVVDGIAFLRLPLLNAFVADANSDWFMVYVSFGEMATGNPLAYRYSDRRGRDAYVRSRSNYPLEDAVALQWFGVGVSNRAGGVVTQINESAVAYTAPVVLF